MSRVEGVRCKSTYTPRGEAGQGWVRVGRYDASRRRALWVRIAPFDPGPNVDGGAIVYPKMDSIELCAGREGDDGYVLVTPDNPIFQDLLDVVLRARDHIEHEHDLTVRDVKAEEARSKKPTPTPAGGGQ